MKKAWSHIMGINIKHCIVAYAWLQYSQSILKMHYNSFKHDYNSMPGLHKKCHQRFLCIGYVLIGLLCCMQWFGFCIIQVSSTRNLVSINIILGWAGHLAHYVSNVPPRCIEAWGFSKLNIVTQLVSKSVSNTVLGQALKDPTKTVSWRQAIK